jgi:apolipoprotein N-acyltransferase
LSTRPQGDWWRFVPPEQPWRLRFKERLRQRWVGLALAFLAYGLVLLWLVLHLPPVVTLLALAPMILLPVLGYLTYWLLWKEFHE